MDIGAGLGSNLHNAVSSLGAEVVNVDISHHAVKYLKEEQKEEGITGDAFMLPFADASISGVLSSSLINDPGSMGENLYDYQIHVEKFMVEIFRILKHDGLFIQANYGGNDAMREITKSALSSSGFRNVIDGLPSAQNMQRFREVTRRNTSGGYMAPLIFIARKL